MKRSVVGVVAPIVVIGSLVYGRVMAHPQAPANLRVQVALVDSELNVRPVPRHALVLRSDPEGAASVRLVTGLDGLAEAAVQPGSYVLESERAVDFQGKSYRWKLPLDILADQPQFVELSTDNAIAEPIAPLVAARPSLPALFKQWQQSVVTVWSETGHGTGFVIDPGGLIATNQHVVGNSDYLAVQFSPTLKVPASVVAKSSTKDIEILRVNPVFTADIPAVRIRFATDGVPPVVEGEEIFTIGSPLNQRKVMTSGIVGKIEPSVIISDININPGNSGGPLFTLEGDVVGITTFGDLTTRGPGISGIVRIDEAAEAISEARDALSSPAPSDSMLPVEPTNAFPLDGLQDTLNKAPVKPKDYRLGVGDFEVSLITPILTYGVQYAAEQAALAERNKRNKKAGIASTPADPFADYKNWAEYVGEFRPVLIVDARPKLVEGFWSAFGRGLAAYQGMYAGPASMHFKSDFRAMKLYCDEHEVIPIHPGKVEHRLAVSNASVRVNDVTYEGFYSYPADAIGPVCSQVKLVVFSEKEPGVGATKILSQALVKRVWDDFAPYRVAAGAQTK